MKNFRFLFFFLFLCSCMVHISAEELPRLKGTWEGWSVFKNLHYRSTLIIYNDSLPSKGSLVIDTSADGKTFTYLFGNGEIDEHGHLIVRFRDETILDLALFREYSAFKLDGTFSRAGQSGTIALLKAR